MTRWRAISVSLMLALAAGGAPISARADDPQAGYYYPAPETSEVYEARAATLADASRNTRLAFVTSLTKEILANPYPQSYAIFAKGENAEKLIIVSMEDGRLNTVYRARAFFASMTAIARLTPVFQQADIDDRFTFFDFAKMLGFTQITISDGDKFAHQVLIK